MKIHFKPTYTPNLFHLEWTDSVITISSGYLVLDREMAEKLSKELKQALGQDKDFKLEGDDIMSKDTMAYLAGVEDGRNEIIELLQQEGGEIKLYALFDKDELVDVSEDRSDLAHREDIEKGMIIAEKTIAITLDANHWRRRDEWYPYGRQWITKKCYNHPLTDPDLYSVIDEKDRGSSRKEVVRECAMCKATEMYLIRRGYPDWQGRLGEGEI